MGLSTTKTPLLIEGYLRGLIVAPCTYFYRNTSTVIIYHILYMIIYNSIKIGSKLFCTSFIGARSKECALPSRWLKDILDPKIASFNDTSIE